MGIMGQIQPDLAKRPEIGSKGRHRVAGLKKMQANPKETSLLIPYTPIQVMETDKF
jgi:hypothetical protein